MILIYREAAPIYFAVRFLLTEPGFKALRAGESNVHMQWLFRMDKEETSTYRLKEI